MSNVSNLPFHNIVFCAGWMAKNMHSAFDYIFNSAEKDSTCAHVLADWGVQVDGKYIGGLSLRFDAIQTEKTKATNMMNLLYLHQKKYFGQRELKIFFASFVRFYPDFLCILKKETQGKFIQESNHPLVFKVKNICRDLQISDELFMIWHKEICNDFTKRNFMGLPVSSVDQETLVDGRSVVGTFRKVEKSSNASYAEIIMLKEKVDTLVSENSDLKRKFIEHESKMTRVLKTLLKNFNEIKEVVQNFSVYENNQNFLNEDAIYDEETEVLEGDNVNNNALDDISFDQIKIRIKTAHLKTLLFDYYDLRYEHAYEQLSSELKDNKLRSFTKRMKRIIDGIQSFQPSHLSYDKFKSRPGEPNKLMNWKLDLQTYNDLCYENIIEAFKEDNKGVASTNYFLNNYKKYKN